MGNSEGSAKNVKTPTTEEARSFEKRFGKPIADQGTAAIPALIFRFQGDLGLTDTEVVMLGNLLSFYREQGKWPSVSIRRMADWRGVTRYQVEKSLEELARRGLVRIVGKDAEHESFIYDLSGLFGVLKRCAETERLEKEARDQRGQRRRSLAIPAGTLADAAA